MKKKARAVKAKAIELPAKLSIAQSADWHRILCSCCEAQTPVVLDGSGVEEIDTAMLQLLVSVWSFAAKRGVECRWQGASDSLRHAATLIGVATILKLDGLAETAAVAAA